MGFYGEHVVPRIVNWACSNPEMRRWRPKVTEGLSGRVVEIGFGSGLNVEHYPAEVDVVYAVEPAALARRLAARRIAEGTTPVEHIGLDGHSIPLEDDSCDSALCTFTLCTVREPSEALSELLRVLKPGGALHFLEHGLAPDPKVARWQRRLDPLERRLADGCHLTRDSETLVREAGFEVVSCQQAYARGPKPWSWLTLGVGVNPTLE